jgi:uncharacterized damage-inducible protein DinB
MLQSNILTLYDYNYWANARVLGAAAHVSPAQFLAPAGLSHGSLRGTLAHILGAEWVWRVRCQAGASPAALLAEEEFTTLGALRLRWNEEEQAMRGFLAGLDDAALRHSIHYTNTKGVPFETVLWQILFHVVNHGTQFRSEAGVWLTQVGHSPGDLDFIAFVRERG